MQGVGRQHVASQVALEANDVRTRRLFIVLHEFTKVVKRKQQENPPKNGEK